MILKRPCFGSSFVIRETFGIALLREIREADLHHSRTKPQKHVSQWAHRWSGGLRHQYRPYAFGLRKLKHASVGLIGQSNKKSRCICLFNIGAVGYVLFFRVSNQLVFRFSIRYLVVFPSLLEFLSEFCPDFVAVVNEIALHQRSAVLMLQLAFANRLDDWCLEIWATVALIWLDCSEMDSIGQFGRALHSFR